jgi:hypothetical protein
VARKDKPLIPPTRDSGRVAETGKMVLLDCQYFEEGSSEQGKGPSHIVIQPLSEVGGEGKRRCLRVVEVGSLDALLGVESTKAKARCLFVVLDLCMLRVPYMYM